MVATLRFLTITTLSFLLLSPVLRYLHTEEEKPAVVFIQDQSASEKYAFKKTDSIAYRDQVNALLEDLGKDYTIKTFGLGSRLKDTMRFSYTENGTDLSGGLEQVMTSLENENVGAVILSTDGIYNSGISPLSLSYPFKGSVYTVGLGDTTTQRDALIARVFANKVVYLGDPFSIRTDVAAFSCAGEVLSVSVFHHNINRVVASQQFKAGDYHFSKSIETIVPANVAGVQHFTISVSKVDGEQNVVNNSQDVYIEVMDSKESVLIVANAPHPDIAALKEALTKNKNYKVDVRSAQKMDAQISDYNLIILHNIPSAGYNGSSIIEQAKRLGISVWYILGQQSLLPSFNQSQNALQVAPRGLSLSDAQAIPNKEFSYYTTSGQEAVVSLPPLAIPFADYQLGVNAQTLFYQKLGTVNTTFPLWVLQQTPEQRVGVCAGEGLWRWRLYNFEQSKNFNLVDEVILKTAQFLSVKRDKKQFRTQVQKSVYTESEAIVLDAELYNDNYELINTPDVNVTLIDEAGKKQNFSLNKEGNSYTLNIGSLSAGRYTYAAQTSFNSKNYSASGSFNVVAQNIEEANTTADFGMLNQLAKNYHGEFVTAKEVSSLKEKIRKNESIRNLLRSQVNTEPFIHWKWLFALLALLLSVEWLVRKRNGNY